MLHLHGHSANISGKSQDKDKNAKWKTLLRNLMFIPTAAALSHHLYYVYLTSKQPTLYLHRRLWCIDFPFLWNAVNCKTRCDRQTSTTCAPITISGTNSTHQKALLWDLLSCLWNLLVFILLVSRYSLDKSRSCLKAGMRGKKRWKDRRWQRHAQEDNSLHLLWQWPETWYWLSWTRWHLY